MVSTATFVAAGNEIDLAVDAPVAGSYEGADAMGLFWSQVRVDLSNLHPSLTLNLESGGAALEAISQSGEVAATCSFRRLFHDERVRVTDVRAQGLVGTFFSPKKAGKHPAILGKV